MKKRLIMTILCVGMIATLVTACGSSSKPKESYTSKTTQAYDIEENSEQNTEQQEADRKKQQEELTKQFYSYVKGCYQGNEIYYTFSCLEGQYYYINSESVGDKYTNENYRYSIYLVDEFECTDDTFEATLVENGNTHIIKGKLEDGKCISLTFLNDSEETTLTNISLTSYNELLSQDEYKNCYLSAYFYSDSEDVSSDINWFNYNKDDEIESYRYDVSSETEGDELILKYKDNFSPKFIVLGIKDGVVIPLYERYSSGNEEVYDEDSKTLWFFYDGGTSGGTGHFSLEYEPDRSSYRVIKANTEMEERLSAVQLMPIEDMDLCDRLIYQLSQVEGLPEGYSSSIWDSMTFQFDGMTFEVGKTMFDEFISTGNWDMGEYGGFEGHKPYSTYEGAPDYVTLFTDLERKGCSKTDSKRYKDYEEHPLDVTLKVYDVKDYSRDNYNKTIYSFEYEFFTYIPEEIYNFPQLELMGNVTYNSTFEDVYEIYGTPAYISRGSRDLGGIFVYVSEDYTKLYALSFDSDGKLEKVNLVNYSWFQDKAEIEEDMKEKIVSGRESSYEILQEKRAKK